MMPQKISPAMDRTGITWPSKRAFVAFESFCKMINSGLERKATHIN